MSYVSSKLSDAPASFHRWSAAAVIAATMKRHAHVIIPTGGWKLHPTMYTLLVGRPGLGKGLAMNEAVAIAKEANVINVLGGKLTMPYVLDLLHKGFQPQLAANANGSITVNANVDHSAFMHSSEFSVFMNAYKDSIEVLTDIWDTPDVFMTGSRQWAGKVIHGISLNVLGGSAPEWLSKSIPADAVGGGFTRRVNFVFASKKVTVTSNGHLNPLTMTQMKNDLVSDLRWMSHIKGEFKIDTPVLALLDAYYNASIPDEFDDAASSGYISSKPAHAMKLAMVQSVSRGDDMIINEVDWRNATEMVEEAQEGMKIVFRAIGSSNFVLASDKIIRFLEHKRLNPSPTHQATRGDLMKILWQDLNGTGELDLILGMLIEAGLVRQDTAGRHTIYESTQGGATAVKGMKGINLKGVKP